MSEEFPTAAIPCSGVEYDISLAAISIAELQERLGEMEDDGFEYVAFGSGNHRGARWQRFQLDSWEDAAQS